MRGSALSKSHPQHDLLVEAVRGWYETSYPEQGYVVEARPFGFYGRNMLARHPGTNQVTVRNLSPETVPAFLVDVRAYYGQGRVLIFVDDRDVDATLGPLLVAAGCRDAEAQVYLALVGPLPSVATVPDISIDPVTEDNLQEFVIAKIMGFEDSEEQPDHEQIDADISLRRAEMRGGGSFRLARVGRDPAGIVGWYEGPDRFIFILATRVPYRRRGIGQSLLADAVADAFASGCRSVIINVNPEGGPIGLYRALGFSDEVYWRHRYRFDPDRTNPI